MNTMNTVPHYSPYRPINGHAYLLVAASPAAPAWRLAQFWSPARPLSQKRGCNRPARGTELFGALSETSACCRTCRICRTCRTSRPGRPCRATFLRAPPSAPDCRCSTPENQSFFTILTNSDSEDRTRNPLKKISDKRHGHFKIMVYGTAFAPSGFRDI